MLIALAPYSSAQNSSSQNQPTQADLDRLSETIARVQQQVTTTNSERERTQEEVFAAERTLAELNANVQEVESTINTERNKLLSLQEQSQQLDTQRKQQQDTIALYLRSAWKSGQEEYLKLLLNQEDITQTTRMVRYYQYFNQARAEKIDEYNTTLQDIKNVSEALEATTSSLENNLRTLSSRRNALNAQQRERQQRIDELERILNSRNEELARLEEEREELGLLIEELNRSIANLALGDQDQPFVEMKGSLPWPVNGRLTNSFGSPQELGDLTWQGINISANSGAEVRAIHHGRVVFADWFGNSGLLLIIDHGSGYMSLYAQNQQLFHDVGDWVTSGELIASVGNTGGRRETGLYFEIRKDGSSQDPIVWFQARN